MGDKTEHARISELGNLDKLSGKLRIKNINYVKDPDDAEKVHLKKKKWHTEIIIGLVFKGEEWGLFCSKNGRSVVIRY